jgi:hypothetical protein
VPATEVGDEADTSSPSPELHLPLVPGIPGSDKELAAIADGKRTGELVIPGREITRRCASLAVGQLGASQPVTHVDRQHGEAYCLIIPHETSPPDPLLRRSNLQHV